MEAHLSANKSHPLPEADHAFLLFSLHLPSLGPHESSLSRARIPRHSVPWNCVSGNVAFACSNTCAALCTRTEPLSVPFASARHLHLMTDCPPPNPPNPATTPEPLHMCPLQHATPQRSPLHDAFSPPPSLLAVQKHTPEAHSGSYQGRCRKYTVISLRAKALHMERRCSVA